MPLKSMKDLLRHFVSQTYLVFTNIRLWCANIWWMPSHLSWQIKSCKKKKVEKTGEDRGERLECG